MNGSAVGRRQLVQKSCNVIFNNLLILFLGQVVSFVLALNELTSLIVTLGKVN